MSTFYFYANPHWWAILLPDALNSMFVDRAKEWPNSWEWQASLGPPPSSWGCWDTRVLDCHGEVVSWEAVHEAIFLCPQVPVEAFCRPIKPHAVFNNPHMIVQFYPVNCNSPHTKEIDREMSKLVAQARSPKKLTPAPTPAWADH